jgi:hypothetical protein
VRIFINGSRRAVAEFRDGLPLGCLLNPFGGMGIADAVASGLPWALDNGVYGASRTIQDAWRREAALFPYERFWTRYDQVRKLPKRDRANLRFVVLPDLPGKGVWTGLSFIAYAMHLRDRGDGLPLALVGQDKMESQPWVPFAFDLAAAFFVGGTTEWKLSQAAADMAREAKRRGLWVHMGRVNSIRRLEWAWSIGCDSVDGTGLTRYSRSALPVVRRRLYPSPSDLPFLPLFEEAQQLGCWENKR